MVRIYEWGTEDYLAIMIGEHTTVSQLLHMYFDRRNDLNPMIYALYEASVFGSNIVMKREYVISGFYIFFSWSLSRRKG